MTENRLCVFQSVFIPNNRSRRVSQLIWTPRVDPCFFTCPIYSTRVGIFGILFTRLPFGIFFLTADLRRLHFRLTLASLLHLLETDTILGRKKKRFRVILLINQIRREHFLCPRPNCEITGFTAMFILVRERRILPYFPGPIYVATAEI